MPTAIGVRDHFAAVAPHYQQVRVTDEEPVHVIGECVRGQGLVGLDVGAGNGRYTQLLRRQMAGRASIVAADLSESMLRAAERGASVCCEVERLPIGNGTLDFLTTFNAIHHFDLDSFVEETARALTARGHLFVYTRTPEHNAASIWGREFPGFTSRETRLHDIATFKRALRSLGEVTCRTFTFPRQATPDVLAQRVRARAYSTFSLYDNDELEEALSEFIAKLPCDVVRWHDQNLLVHVTRQG